MKITAITLINTYLMTGNVWIINLLTLLGKFAIAIAASLLWTVTCEVYPTELRNQALSLTSLGGRLASFCAPYIGFLVSDDLQTAIIEGVRTKPRLSQFFSYSSLSLPQHIIKITNLRTVPYHTVPYRTVPYCTVLYCTVLYCTVLYCTVLSVSQYGTV